MIKELREKNKLSQKIVADMMGITQGTISQWESGITKPTTDKLPQLAKIFGCTIDELFKCFEKGE